MSGNEVQDKIAGRINSANECEYSVRKLSLSPLLSKKMNIRIC
jgi:hypothetical protein